MIEESFICILMSQVSEKEIKEQLDLITIQAKQKGEQVQNILFSSYMPNYVIHVT